jgi:N-acetyl-gamma-glutamyl-phosphate/LysW-gamma-L-alpha-aminoadipyl-6-phosphate reductase
MTKGRKVHAVILGAAGYGGGELLRLLGAHPAVVAITAASRSHAGQPFHAAHPHLRGIVEGTFVSEPDWKRKQASVAAGIEVVVFAALPHGEFGARYPDLAAAWAGAGIEDAITVIDLSGDHRLADAAAFARHYGKPHPHPRNLGTFVYGLPEWQRARIAAPAPAGKRIANPGCFATAIQLALLPLLAAGVPLEWVAVSGTTGSSGSGALPSDTTHHPTRANDYRAYKPLVHQHLGEVEQLLAAHRSATQVSFVPHSAPLVRGVSCTLHARVADAALVAEKVKAFYDDEPFVRVVEGAPRLAVVAGSNFCDLGVVADGEQLVVMTALDNLVKGMTGLAVQNMNLALGLDERTGLMQAPIFP